MRRYSWVHREDAVGIMCEALTNPGISGPINVTAPNPVRMGELCTEIGKTLGRPSWLPAGAYTRPLFSST